VVVDVEDRTGSVVTGDSSNVTLAVASGPGALGGTVTVAAVNGVATFSNAMLYAAGSYTLSVSDGSLTGATTGSFAISHARAAKMAFTHAHSDVVAGVTMTPALVVRIKDAYGNLCSNNTSTVTLGVVSGPARGKLLNAAAVSAVGGIATFSNVALNKAGAYTLSATDGTLGAATSSSFTVTHAAAAKLVFVQVPATATRRVAITPPVTVEIADAYGNLCAGNRSTVTINGLLTAQAVGGIATFSNVILKTVGSQTLTATDDPLTEAISAAILVS
jgi:hypothetical protein